MSRVVRYPLPIVPYQQLQPLWPGQILGVALGQYDDRGHELAFDKHRVDMWGLDNDDARGTRLPPILGVWMVLTGEAFPDSLLENAADAIHHGTIDRRPYAGALHVFSAVVGYATRPEPEPTPHYSSVDDMAAQIAARHKAARDGG